MSCSSGVQLHLQLDGVQALRQGEAATKLAAERGRFRDAEAAGLCHRRSCAVRSCVQRLGQAEGRGRLYQAAPQRTCADHGRRRRGRGPHLVAAYIDRGLFS